MEKAGFKKDGYVANCRLNKDGTYSGVEYYSKCRKDIQLYITTKQVMYFDYNNYATATSTRLSQLFLISIHHMWNVCVC